METSEKTPVKVKKPNIRIDMHALEGLRGLAALHILISHFHFNSPLETPLFYALSGFFMAVAYGQASRRVYKSEEEGGAEEIVKKLAEAHKEEEGMLKKSLRFYRNRLARILPMFYLSNIAQMVANVYSCIDMKSRGEKEFWLKIMLSMTMTNCWFGPFLLLLGINTTPFNGPSWQMTTMTFFYLVFPLILPLIQRMSSNKLRSLVVWMYLFQLISALIYIWDNPVKLWKQPKKNPLNRLPVFVMGIASGLLRLRHQSERQDGTIYSQDGELISQDGGLNQNGGQNQGGGLNPSRNFLHDLLPWGVCGGGGEVLMRREERERRWRWKVDWNAAVLVLAVFVLHYVPAAKPFGQFFSPHIQLIVIYGLTDDGQKSFLSMVCRLRITRILGNISMTFWLLHFPLRHFLLLALNHPECNEGLNYKMWWHQRTRNPPDWLSHLLIPIVLFVSFWVNKWFEQPMRDWLKTKNVKK